MKGYILKRELISIDKADMHAEIMGYRVTPVNKELIFDKIKDAEDYATKYNIKQFKRYLNAKKPINLSRKEEKSVWDVLKSIEDQQGLIPVAEAEHKLMNEGLSALKIEEYIAKLKKKGDIFEPRNGFLKAS